MKETIAVLVSGSGSNLQALIEACAQEEFPARIGLVLSNKDDAYGLVRAQKAGIPTQVIRHKDFPDRGSFDDAMHAALVAAGIGFVCLAGFMRLLTPGFVEKWAGRMINIHPSLLPLFKGMHTHASAIAAGVKIHGCTVHHVVAEMDAGPIIMQAAVPVLSSDTPETLGARVLKAEHAIYPMALRQVLAGHGEEMRATAGSILIG